MMITLVLCRCSQTVLCPKDTLLVVQCPVERQFLFKEYDCSRIVALNQSQMRKVMKSISYLIAVIQFSEQLQALLKPSAREQVIMLGIGYPP
jgi:hypothetical protein